ncbi:hypothetical protein [Pseudarthrobacter sp. C4D7]|uniref:hypothetical protein n=1 Tax=Pseudarthrobacter sp. C4D7 TaxID=2735268 RepID=UPI0015854C39|nr:hypothetical protein [Pseudarthrobacter sp. C4D7]NUT72885.1 hypothetical protein [Pseudarthrobacter sp. C4D7]
MNSQATHEAPRGAVALDAGQEAPDADVSKQLPGLRADWARLAGRRVEVWLQDECVASGVVDQAAEDGSVLWIAAQGISTRRIFDKSSGYQIRV